MDSITARPACYRKQWKALQKADIRSNALSQLAKQTAGSFMDHYYQNDYYDKEYIDLLCEMATCSSDPELSRAVSSAFFGIIIEELCDDYENFQFEVYTRVMSQVISYCRKIPAGDKFDRYLNQFNLFTADDIYRRANRIHFQDYRFTARPETIKQIFLLSRVTIGADVAIVSVMIQRLSKLFPDAQIILLGGPKLKEIFGGNRRLRLREVAYIRNSGLFERLTSWCELVDVISRETKTDGVDGAILIDSDSRLTQLGVLPVFKEENYLYFNSHPDIPSAGDICMGELTNAWIDKVFGRPGFCWPRLWIQPGLLKQARRIIQPLRKNGCQKITTVNFGVGGNPRKRLGLAFEKKLICELLRQPNRVVILDRGCGPEELAGSQEIINEVKNKGFDTHQTDFEHGRVENFSQGLLAVECGVGQIAALIDGSDEFIGYDSACQHIAAALAVPAVTVFAGSNNPHFIRRWSACGNTSCKTVHVDTLDHPDQIDLDDIIDRILESDLSKVGRSASKRKIVDIKKAQTRKNKIKIMPKSRTV